MEAQENCGAKLICSLGEIRGLDSLERGLQIEHWEQYEAGIYP